MRSRNIHFRKWIQKIIITTTYSANLAQKHSFIRGGNQRERDTDRVYPAVRVPAHILLLLISKKCDIIHYTHTYDYVAVQDDSFCFLCLLIKSNWSYVYTEFSINKYLAAIYQCRVFFLIIYIHTEFVLKYFDSCVVLQ